MVAQDTETIIDRQEQLEKVKTYCLPGEAIRAVFDLRGAATGFLGITDRRVIFYDKAFLQGKKAMVSIPHSRIVAVSTEDETGFLVRKGLYTGDTLVLEVMGIGPKVFEFRSGERAHMASRILMEHVLG